MASKELDLDRRRRREDAAPPAALRLRRHVDDIVRQPLTGRMRELVARLGERGGGDIGASARAARGRSVP